MGKSKGSGRAFLFLQGPHGPFFAQVAGQLRKAGAETFRVGFNIGDRMFWTGGGYLPFKGRAEDWPDAFTKIIADNKITDIVIYGDTRPVHARAIEIARAQGVMVHVFEEGYLRPHWVTYERGGSNGFSKLMDTPL
ncbi:MAG: capsular polysaccharide export protein, partial [Dinoroseobacter sp.]